MRYREGGSLDTSAVQDRRGGGGGLGGGRGLAVGGGGLGLVGLLVVVLVQVLGGGGGSTADLAGVLGGLGSGQTADNGQLRQSCDDSGDANQSVDCAVVADIESIQDYWAQAVPGYQPAQTIFFSGQVQTACGGATSGSGPFYCPGGRQGYNDPSFFPDPQTPVGAGRGAFVQPPLLGPQDRAPPPGPLRTHP